MPSTLFLRRVLGFDALTCLAMGALLLAAGGVLASLLGLPVALLREAGLILLVFAAFVFWAARHADRSLWPARTVAFANLAWVAASFALFLFVSPTPIGILFVTAQALAVAGIAAAQFHSLSRLRTAHG